MPFLIFIAVVIFIVLCIVIANVKIVPQANAYVIEKLGAYSTTWGTGLHVKVPFFDRIARKVSLKEQTFRLSRLSQRIMLQCRSTQLYISR